MKRLNMIAEMLPFCETIADIGCDHGLLGQLILKFQRAKFVIATDISNQSLNKAKLLAVKKHLPMTTRLGDGLTVLKAGEAQCAVISGMGGLEILNILSDERRIDGITDFVVSPHSELTALRSGLEALGLRICEERIIGERKHRYFVMRLERGFAHYTSFEQEFGLLIHAPTSEFQSYLVSQIEMVEQKLKKHGNITALIEELARLRQVREGKID